MSKTKIEWCDDVWNPIIGCTPVGIGCDHCYAEGQVNRFQSKYDRPTTIKLGAATRPGLTFTPTHPITGKSLGKGAKWTGAVWLLPDVLEVPLRRRKPTAYFVNSQSDVFHESVVGCEEGRRFIAAMFGVMAATPQHTFQLLTKRPEQAAKWFEWLAAHGDSPTWSLASFGTDAGLPTRWTDHPPRKWAWPLPNVWLVTSVEDQAAADERIPALLELPAALRGLSVEPMLGPINLGPILANVPALPGKRGASDWFSPLTGRGWDAQADTFDDEAEFPSIDWVICGGESGPKARPMHPDWARSLRDQCVGSGVPFFFKQWGEHAPSVCEDWFTHGGDEARPHTWVARDGSRGLCWIVDDDGSWSNWTGDAPDRASADVAVMSKVGKAAAGRELDGRLWDEYPV
jgi:protein gp37